MRTVLVTSARDVWQASASRFGQARAIANARRAATGLSRERVEREEVRLYLETLVVPEPDGTAEERRRAAAGHDT